MGKNLFRGEIVQRTVFFKGFDTPLSEWLCLPLTLVFGKEGKGCGANLMGVKRCIFNAASSADMGSNKFHKQVFFCSK